MAIKRITTNLIKDSDIATVDIANNAITAAKITDGNITTAKLADLSVTAGKLAGTLDLTGKTITVATATTGDNDTSPASTAFVQQEIAALVDSSPDSLNTLNELAAALGDDASFSTTVTNSIATKLPLTGGTLTGNLAISTTGASQISLLDSDNGFSASTINVENGGRDFKITTPQDTIFVQGSSESMRILDGGNVGIGTSSPTTHLSVANSGFTNTSTSGIPAIRAEGSYGGAIGLLDTKEAGWYAQDNGDTLYQYVGRASGTAPNASVVMTYKSSGNVGIGTTSPSQKLEVDGRIKLGGMILQNTVGGGSIGLNRNPADGADISGLSLRRFQINGPGTTSGDYLEFQSYNSSGTSVGNVRIQDGKLGIGDTPALGLHVADTKGVLFGPSGSGASTYISPDHENTINGGYGLDTDTGDVWINYRGYQNGTSRFRDFRVGNGKEGLVAMFDGSSGQMGIGTGSPSEMLHMYNTSGTACFIRFQNTGGSGVYIGGRSEVMEMYTNGSEKMRITSDGYVGIGTAAPTAKLDVRGSVNSEHAVFTGGTNSGRGLSIQTAASGGQQDAGVIFDAQDTESGANPYLGFKIAGDEKVRIQGSTLYASTDIGAHSNVTSFAHSTYAHAAVFGANSTPDGTVVIEDYDVSSGIGNTVLKLYLRDQDPATHAVFIDFSDGGGRVGSVTHNDDGGGVTYNTTSDYRLKENVNYTWDALSLLTQLKPAKFNFIGKTDKTRQGFLAHEVMDIVPGSVRGTKDQMEPVGTITDNDGNVVNEGVYEHFCKEGQTWTQTGTEPYYQQLDYARLVPLLTKAIQEQQTIIDDLKSRLDEAGL